MIYTPLKPNQSPVYGASGDAVKAYQTQLNTTNLGQAGYTPLKVDGLYGPITQTASTYKAPAPVVQPPPPPEATAGQVYSYGGETADPKLTSALNEQNTNYQTMASGGSIIDENQVRADTLKSFQAEIDAQNALYAQKLSEARVAGQGRIGSDTAIQARRGMLGSTFGSAEADTVVSGNKSIEEGINAEKNTAISGILSKARDAGTAAIAAKTLAKTQGLDAYIANLKTSAETKAKTATSIAKDMLAKTTETNIVDPNKFDKETLQKIADAAGVTPDSIKSAFATEKVMYDANKLKLKQEADKAAADLAKTTAETANYAADNVYKTNALGETIRHNKADEANSAMQNVIAREKNAGSTTTTTDENGNVIITGNPDPLDVSRWNLAASRATKTFRDTQVFKAAQNADFYIAKIKAASEGTGSIQDQEILDSISQFNTGGGRVTESQVNLILKGKSFGDTVNSWNNKLKTGGVLSDTQRKQALDLAKATGTEFLKNYKEKYTPMANNLKKQKIPQEFWGIPTPEQLSGELSDTPSSPAKGTDGAAFGFPGYHSDGSQWVPN